MSSAVRPCPAPAPSANARASCSSQPGPRRWVNSGCRGELASIPPLGVRGAAASILTRSTRHSAPVPAGPQAASAWRSPPASCVRPAIGAGKSTRPSLNRRRHA